MIIKQLTAPLVDICGVVEISSQNRKSEFHWQCPTQSTELRIVQHVTSVPVVLTTAVVSGVIPPVVEPAVGVGALLQNCMLASHWHRPKHCAKLVIR